MTTENDATAGAEEERSLRDDIEAAVAQVESDFDAGEGDTSGQATAEAGAEPASEVEEGAGEAAAATPDEGVGETADTAAGDRAAGAYPDDTTRYPNLEEKLDKAPAKWRPGAREGWDQLPEHVRREIHRRELDIAMGQQNTAEARRFQADVTEMFGPHAELMKREGAPTPMHAIKGLLDTAVLLDSAAPEVKADKIARMIQHYGIDTGMLDSALARMIRGNGGAPPPAARTDLDAALDRRLGPIQEFMDGLKSRINEAGEEQVAAASAELEAFRESAEFLDDVRLDMADILDMATARGRRMSVQEAYDMACQMHPEIRTVLASRAAESSAASQEQRVAEKVERSRTVLTGRRAGTTPQTSEGDLRQDIERAFDAHTG